jgi:hypothetical protein
VDSRIFIFRERLVSAQREGNCDLSVAWALAVLPIAGRESMEQFRLWLELQGFRFTLRRLNNTSPGAS